MITGEGYRITVLSSCLFRIEVNKNNIFTDEPTQIVFYRDFPKVEYSVSGKRFIIIATADSSLCFDTKMRKVFWAVPKGMKRRTKCDNKGNLKGTYRTLDQKFKAFELNDGILSKRGVAVMKDNTLCFDEKGEIIPRKAKGKDFYIFAHGHDYFGALKDFFALTGNPPAVPRFALGNWWSRYRAYTQEEYMGVINAFEENKVPLTVATIDMDWHWTDLNTKFGTNYPGRPLMENPCTGGWTGYSWNTDLFPDYKAFLKWLHDKNLKTTLNLHPASGVRWFEDMYEDMCRELGVDPSTKQDIPFDITDPKFINAYFKILHKPYEKDGVDFWWIDWQQGKKTKIPGLDPLYALNHFHYLDNGKDNKEPLILSRYAGLGSHRYPLGFSGDTFTNWAILDFIPYFTSTASNAGYTWWSHDIGGHMFGRRDDELYLRWIQFGVFNPILRLHSTCNELESKEPWRYGRVAEVFAKKYLRLRKQLVPYLYTMQHLTHTEGRPLCIPMYYGSPDEEQAYSVKNEYYFGTELIVAPITKKINKSLNMARTKVYLPEGRWTDIFTGQVYMGGKSLYMYRDLTSIPVLAKQGAILPLDADDVTNGVELPKELVVWVYRGTGSFDLVEEIDGKIVKTPFVVSEADGKVTFTKSALSGSMTRKYYFLFRDITAGKAIVSVNGKKVQEIELTKDLPVTVDNITADDTVTVEISDYTVLTNPTMKEHIITILSKFQGSSMNKRVKFGKIKKHLKDEKMFVSRAMSLYTNFISDAFEENTPPEEII